MASDVQRWFDSEARQTEAIARAERDALAAEVSALRAALERIANGQECEKVVKTADPRSWCRNRDDQSPDAPYLADRWCDPCIARDALGRYPKDPA